MSDWLSDYARHVAVSLVIGAVLGLLTALLLGY